MTGTVTAEDSGNGEQDSCYRGSSIHGQVCTDHAPGQTCARRPPREPPQGRPPGRQHRIGHRNPASQHIPQHVTVTGPPARGHRRAPGQPWGEPGPRRALHDRPSAGSALGTGTSEGGPGTGPSQSMPFMPARLVPQDAAVLQERMGTVPQTTSSLGPAHRPRKLHPLR